MYYFHKKLKIKKNPKKTFLVGFLRCFFVFFGWVCWVGFFGWVFYCQPCKQGHYWAYVHHPARRVWLKFNDNTVSETTWDALKRESTGSRMNTSAYSLVNKMIVCACVRAWSTSAHIFYVCSVRSPPVFRIRTRTGSTCFLASWIRIRILLSSCKNNKKNLESYYFVTLFDLLSLKIM